MDESSKLAKSKIIIIYLLHKVDMPVPVSYIHDFILDSECMDYFELSANLVELVSSNYIYKSYENNKTLFSITENGDKVLSLFKNIISNFIKEKIDSYVEDNKNKFNNRFKIISEFKQVSSSEYEVFCGFVENDNKIVSLTFKVPNEKYAKIMTDNWREDASRYYLSFMRSLLNLDSEK